VKVHLLPYFPAAMSRTQRIALVAAALVVAVVAFVIARPDDDAGSGESARTTPAQTETDGGATQPPEAEPPPAESGVTRIQIRGGSVVGGTKDVEVEAGETVRIVVSADAPDEIHLHGYDITRDAAPGRPARFRFDANLEGIFEMESHVAADAGRDPLVARVVVEPS
jgi:hypothetical protein